MENPTDENTEFILCIPVRQFSMITADALWHSAMVVRFINVAIDNSQGQQVALVSFQNQTVHIVSYAWASCQIRKIAGCACAGNAGNVFPRHRLQWKTPVSYPGMHHGTCVTHVPWCMSGLLVPGGGENVPGIPRRMRTRNFSYLARGPWHCDNHMIGPALGSNPDDIDMINC